MTLTCILFWILCLDPIQYEAIEKINYAHVQCEQITEVEPLQPQPVAAYIEPNNSLRYVYVSYKQPQYIGYCMERLRQTFIF